MFARALSGKVRESDLPRLSEALGLRLVYATNEEMLADARRQGAHQEQLRTDPCYAAAVDELKEALQIPAGQDLLSVPWLEPDEDEKRARLRKLFKVRN